MTLRKLELRPSQSGYAATHGAETIRTQLDGGASRYRLDIIGASASVNVQWETTREGFQYLQAFYRTATMQGSEPFLIDLILGDASLTEHTAHFVPTGPRLTGVRGLTYTVSAQLEAIPNATDETFDQGVIDLYGTYGGQGAAIFDAINQLANVDMPESLAP